MLQVEKRNSFEINKAERTDDTLVLFTDRGTLRIIPLSEQMIRINFTKRNYFTGGAGVGIEEQKSFERWEYEVSPKEIVIKTELLTVKVDAITSAISYYDKTGRALLCERHKESRTIEAFDAFRTVIDEHTVIRKVETPDGIKNMIEYATKYFDKELYHTTTYFKWQDKEVLYGLGQPDDGVLNLRGSVRYLHQANLKIAMPVILSSMGYGLLFPTGSPAIFSDLNYEDSFIYTEADEEYNYYFLYGPKFDEIIKNYRSLTGKASMLPKWMFGYIQSQERYETQAEIEELVATMREKRIGIDTVVLDWHYWADELWGQKSFDKERFPDPYGMIKKLHEEHVRFMISIWPCMHEKSENYREMKEKSLLLPASDIYDAFNEEGRKLYWEQADKGLFQYGVDAWWCDSCEPFTPEWIKEKKPISQVMYDEYLKQSRERLPADMGNCYGLVHAKGIYEGQRRTSPEKRVVNLTRSGYLGSQKYGTVLWSGDISASWKTLKEQIAAGLNFCASGHPYWTFDIGAFFVKRGKPWFWNGEYDNGTDDLGYCELFVRWYQLGALLPIFRNHGTDVRRELWEFGKKHTRFYEALLSANELRYELIPYIYSCAGEAWCFDGTIMRLLAFDFMDDEKVLCIDDQYMFGKSLMVCPVTEPMYYDADSVELNNTAKQREVYLPEGTDWYDYYTGKKYRGGQVICVEADIMKIPLFVKAGSVIPVSGRKITSTDELNGAGIKLKVYSGNNSSYYYYEDAGDGYEYENGDYVIRKIEWNDDNRKLTVEEVKNKDYVSDVTEVIII